MLNIIELIPKVANMAEFLGYNLKLMRENKGLTQIELAKAVPIDQPTISKWENDKAHPPKQYWEALTRTLSLPEDFFERDWAPPFGTYDIQDIVAEWSIMKDRIANLEKQMIPGSFQPVTPSEIERRDELIPAWTAAEPEQRIIGLLVLTLDDKYLKELSPRNQKLFEPFLKAARSRQKPTK